MASATTDVLPAPGLVPAYDDLLGKPFRSAGRGPDAFDCYGLVMELHKRLGVAIPEVRTPEGQASIAALVVDEAVKWRPCHLGPGAVVTFRLGRHVSHVALMVSRTRFLHVWEGADLGVAREPIEFWRHRIAGVYRWVE